MDWTVPICLNFQLPFTTWSHSLQCGSLLTWTHPKYETIKSHFIVKLIFIHFIHSFFSSLSSSLYPSLAHPFQFNLPYSVCYLKNNNKIRSTEQDVHEMKINKWLCIRKLFGCTSCHALWNSSSHFIRFIFTIHKSDFCHDSVTDNLLLCVIKKQR